MAPKPGRANIPAVIAAVTGLAVAAVASLTYMRGTEDKAVAPAGNAVWLGKRWLAEERDDEEIIGLLSELRSMRTPYLFLHLCPMDQSGDLPEFNEDGLKKFIKLAQETYPDAMPLPWIGGVAGKTVDLADAGQMDRFAEAAARLTTELGCPGVHLNIEPIKSGDVRYLALLDRLKDSIGPGKLLSVAAFPPRVAEVETLKRTWSEDFLAEVARRCDQVVVMSYDSGTQTPNDYIGVVANWTEVSARAVASAKNSSLLMGVPTYEDRTAFHHPGIENMQNALAGVTAGKARLGQNAPVLAGVAVYAYWTTGPEEWLTFREEWME